MGSHRQDSTQAGYNRATILLQEFLAFKAMASLEAVKKTQVLTVKFLQEFATFLTEYKHTFPEGDVYYKPATWS
jgi:hypothetical protein